jgi:hypothetical protein
MNHAWNLFTQWIYLRGFTSLRVNFDYTCNRATIQVDIYEFKKLPSPILTEEIQSWLFVQCYVPIDRGIQFALRKMIAWKNWSQRRISAKLKSHLKFPHIHFVRIRKNVNIYFFVSTLNKEINIYACIYAYKWMCTWLEALIFLLI